MPWQWSGDEPLKTGDKPASFAANGAFSANLAHADQEKDRAFIQSIVTGNFHNQAALGVESALSAMLGRMAGRLAREVSWEELLAHDEQYKAE